MRPDASTADRATTADETNIIDTETASELLREPDAAAAVRLLAGTFLAVGVGTGLTALLYDALGPSGRAAMFGGGVWLSTVQYVAPVIAAAGGLHVGRRLSARKARLAALAGSALGYVGFSLALYVFGGLVAAFGGIDGSAQIGALVGVSVAGLLGAFVRTSVDEL